MNPISIELLSFTLPIIFMLHDFEEIIMVGAWQKKYGDVLESTVKKPFTHWVSTASGTVAVLIEFLLLLTVSCLSVLFQNYLIWYGMYFVFIAHFLIHYYMSIRFKHYTPGVTTAVIFMPLCLYILYCAGDQTSYSKYTVIIVCLICLLFFIFFFRWLTSSIKSFGNWLTLYANKRKGSKT